MKPASEFYARRDGRVVPCKTCIAAERRAHYARNAEDLKKRRRDRYDPARRREVTLQSYGLSVAEFDALLEEQGNKCAVCSSEDPGPKGRFVVDHDHETGRVRGLLCHYCNVGIGHFSDDPERLIAAWTYLVRTTEEVTAI